MLQIQLIRLNSIKDSYYKIILNNKYHTKIILKLGYYNPQKKNLYINKYYINKYVNIGSYITNTIRHLIYKHIRNMFI